MAMRTDEQFCQEAFGAYLRVRHSVLPDEWVQEPRGQKTPPDFHLYWHGVTFAVEVTGLMSQYEQTEGASISELGVLENHRASSPRSRTGGSERRLAPRALLVDFGWTLRQFLRVESGTQKSLDDLHRRNTDDFKGRDGVRTVGNPIRPDVLSRESGLARKRGRNCHYGWQ